ncbi:Tethering factor for nuclear proteasome sts1 [Rhizoclosmatium hyalinum]|nr:Tethering factor for nuclear proteasome sts1 [Rhizoclosmatium hyalinum]
MSQFKVSWGTVLPAVNSAADSFGSLASESMSLHGSAQSMSAASGASAVESNTSSTTLPPSASATTTATATAAAAAVSHTPTSTNTHTSTSTRKRKVEEDDFDMDSNSASNSNSTSTSPSARSRPRIAPRVAPAKRLRLVWDGERERDGQANETERSLPLARILETLEKDQLLGLLKDLVKADPSLASKAAALLPRPTLDSAARHLLQSLDALDQAFPYSQRGRDRSSDYAANRVKKHLQHSLEILSLYLTHFTEPCSYPLNLIHEYPQQSFAFLSFAASQILPRLPIFQTSARNQDSHGTHEAYRLVARAWRVSIAECNRRVREEGRLFPSQMCGGWLRDLISTNQFVISSSNTQSSNESQSQSSSSSTSNNNNNNNASSSNGGKFGFQEAIQEFMRGEIGWIAVESNTQHQYPPFESFHHQQQQQQSFVSLPQQGPGVNHYGNLNVGGGNSGANNSVIGF